MAESTAGTDWTPSGSSWSDVQTGTTEEAAFIGPAAHRILAFLHRPTSGPLNGGVVLCSSLYEDFRINYRRELFVARALARRGFAAVRFHYRGTGNSEDLAGRGVTFESIVSDTRAATSWLVERTGSTHLTMCGHRMGALVAAEVARAEDHIPLVLWAPILDGAAFFRGMSRANRLAGVRATARARQTGGEAATGSSRDEGIDMLGFRVEPESYEDLSARRMPPSVGRGRRVLLVQLGTGDADNPQYDDLVSRWTAGGASVEVLKVQMRQLWMVPETWEPEGIDATTRGLVEGIADRIVATAGVSP
jgi:pimeloyl-ACP methyl ester carboxylesterase